MFLVPTVLFFSKTSLNEGFPFKFELKRVDKAGNLSGLLLLLFAFGALRTLHLGILDDLITFLLTISQLVN